VSVDIFKILFGKDPKELGTTHEIEKFVEEKKGCKLKIGKVEVFKVVSMDADEIFDKAINKRCF
jgi:hypothetical protein